MTKTKKNEYDNQFYRYEALSDNELIAVIQEQYNNYRSGGRWECQCGEFVNYNDVMKNTNKKVLLKIKCPKCKKTIEKFHIDNKDAFHSSEFDQIIKRYEGQIKNDCNNFRLEDKDDMFCDMFHRLFIAVMTYNGTSKFYTYLRNLLNRRFEDFERKHSRACRTSAVQCQSCGRWVGAITRNHLMNNKNKPIKGYSGHSVLHDKIIEEYGKNKFELIDDEGRKLKSIKWEGNDYNKKQRQLVKDMIVQTYREMFPSSSLSMNNISISDRDPNTDIEYIDMIADTKKQFNQIRGVYRKDSGATMFAANSMPLEIQEMCDNYASRMGKILDKKFLLLRKRKKFKDSHDLESLTHMLSKTFSMMFFGYDINDISLVHNYDINELKFWVKQLKIMNKNNLVMNF